MSLTIYEGSGYHVTKGRVNAAENANAKAAESEIPILNKTAMLRIMEGEF